MPDTLRIALATPFYPESREAAVEATCSYIRKSSALGARIVCFPECFVPGYRRPGHSYPTIDAQWLEHAWQRVAESARANAISVILGTERLKNDVPLLTALVIDSTGKSLGFQDKVQLDPTEESIYAAGNGRNVFELEGVKIGIVICHEGFRYPETARAAARKGAQIIFHPHYSWAEGIDFPHEGYGHPANSFHENAALCRAAENTCFYATVNYAEAGSPTTTAIATPDGSLLNYLPRGSEGLLVADIDLVAATGLLASRLRSQLADNP